MSDHTPFFPENLEDYAPWVATHGLVAPYGQCQCGCGQITGLADKNYKQRGALKGHPVRFVSGHQNKLHLRYETQSKACPRCKIIKPLGEFHTDRSRPLGVRPICKACGNAEEKERRALNPEKHKEDRRKWRYKNRERLLDGFAERRQAFRDALFAILGDKCVRCGFSDERALQFDHINGGGNKHRQEFGSWYAYMSHLVSLSDDELKSNLQVLCANCNQIKKIEKDEYGDGKKNRRKSVRNR